MSTAPADIQEKIAAARREAETLKEKIRSRRDQLADTSCACTIPLSYDWASRLTVWYSTSNGGRDRTVTQNSDESS